mgnify:CR=1 FL=1
MLSDILLRVPEEEAVLELVSHFDNLLRKYANYLRYEDAYNDLLLFSLNSYKVTLLNQLSVRTTR